MTRDEWEAYERVVNEPDVQLAMRARCEEQGHEIEYGVSMFMRVSRHCKWCGEPQ